MNFAVTPYHATIAHILEGLAEATYDYIYVRHKEPQHIIEALLAAGIPKEQLIAHRDISLVTTYDVAGVHFRETDCLQVFKQQFPNKLAGQSVHSQEAAIIAASQQADYLFFGHVFPSASKQQQTPKGLTTLQRVCQAVSIPVIAIGGMHMGVEQQIRAVGAHGMAMISSIFSRFDVLVVGGGVMGCATAWRLAEAGQRVAVIEQQTIGSGASNAAGGMLGAQNEWAEENPLQPFALEAREAYPALQRELLALTGIDIEWQNAGLIKVADTALEQQALTTQYAYWQQHEVAWFDDVSQCDAYVHAECGLYFQRDGQVNARQLTEAYKQAMLRYDVQVFEHEQVVDVFDGGVRTIHQTLFADKVVVTTGAWGDADCVSPVKGECVMLHAPDVQLEKTIFHANGCYIVPKANHRFLIGATSIANDFSRHVTAKGVQWLLDQALRIVPALATAAIVETWTGLRPQTRDGLPLMGLHPTIPNVYVHQGHYRNGILLSHCLSEKMARLILGDRAILTQVEAFSPSRLMKEVST